MNKIWSKALTSSIVGFAFGALVIGGVWYTTSSIENTKAIAKVGNTRITNQKFIKETLTLGGTQSLVQLIQTQLLNYGAKKYNVIVTKTDIDNALKTLEKQSNIRSEAQLKQTMYSDGMTSDSLNTWLRDQVLEKKLSTRNVKVTIKDVDKFYNRHKMDFKKRGKTQPLKNVKTNIYQYLESLKAKTPQQVFAELAKEDPIKIYDPAYEHVMKSFEMPHSSPAVPRH